MPTRAGTLRALAIQQREERPEEGCDDAAAGTASGRRELPFAEFVNHS
jgi:hypothetical protein